MGFKDESEEGSEDQQKKKEVATRLKSPRRAEFLDPLHFSHGPTSGEKGVGLQAAAFCFISAGRSSLSTEYFEPIGP